MRLLPMLLLLLSLPAFAAPQSLTHSGRILDNAGDPVDGTHTLTSRMYTTPTGTTAQWTEVQTVTFEDGYFAVALGTVNPFGATLFDGDEVYLALALDGGAELTGRLRLRSVAYALRADTSTNVKGGVVDATEIRIGGTTVIDNTGTLTSSVAWTDITGKPADLADGVDNDTLEELVVSCASDQIAQFTGAAWTCADLEIDATQVVSGTLAIGRLPVGDTAGTVALGEHVHDAGDTTTGTFAIGRLPVGTTAGTVAAGVHVHAAGDVTSGTLDVARIPTGTTSSTVALGNHTHSASTITTGTLPAAVLPGGISAIADLQCAVGDSPTWNGTTWACGKPTTPLDVLTQGVKGTFKMCGQSDNASVGCRPDAGFVVTCLRTATDIGSSADQELFSSDFLSPAAAWIGPSQGWTATGRGAPGVCANGALMFTPTDSGGVATPTRLHHCGRNESTTVGCRYPQDGWPVICHRDDVNADSQRGGFMVPEAHFQGGEWRGTARGSGGPCTYGVWFWNYQ